MTITWLQALLFAIFACLASMPGMGGTVIGNYTLGRPLVAGLVVGIIVGDIQTGIIVGAAIQVIYIALVTPGGTVSADVRAISYIGIPLSIAAIKGLGLDPSSSEAAQMAAALGAAVGTLGTVLFYGTATINLVWQHIGWKAVDRGDFKKLYMVDMGLPWISHFICSFLPTLIITKMGSNMVDIIKTALPMDGMAMKTLFTVGSLLPAVGIAILLKQVVNKATDMLTFLFGFILAACMGVNLIGAAILGGFFAVINYRIKMLQVTKPQVSGPGGRNVIDDDDEEEI
ncbi:MAG: PTS mannose/fructose/sorbose/N-acetylgalactosamine transporter subunit IIC [Clostridium butyricum]